MMYMQIMLADCLESSFARLTHCCLVALPLIPTLYCKDVTGATCGPWPDSLDDGATTHGQTILLQVHVCS